MGTIFGIWPGSRLTGITGRELAASGIATYGPRTTITLAIDSMEGAHEFLLVDDFTARHGQWVKTNTFTSVKYVSKQKAEAKEEGRRRRAHPRGLP